MIILSTWFHILFYFSLNIMPGASSSCYTVLSTIILSSYMLFLQADTQVTPKFLLLWTRMKGTTVSRTQNFLPLWISSSGQIPRGGINGSSGTGKPETCPLGLHRNFWHWVGPEDWYGLKLPPPGPTQCCFQLGQGHLTLASNLPLVLHP